MSRPVERGQRDHDDLIRGLRFVRRQQRLELAHRCRREHVGVIVDVALRLRRNQQRRGEKKDQNFTFGAVSAPASAANGCFALRPPASQRPGHFKMAAL